MSIITCIKSNRAQVFRRLYFKRRLSGGEYESTWTRIPDKYVMSWGQIKFSSDDIKVNFWNYSGLTIQVRNNDGYFANTDDDKSVFYQMITRYKTMVKVSAGYIDSAGTELPTQSTLYIGVIAEDMPYKEDNKVQFSTKHISSIFQEIPADQVIGLGTTQTASDIVTKIRDFKDSNNVYIFQKYISSGAWYINTTSAYYNIATTSALQGMTCWDVLKKISEAENYTMYLSPDGNFYFQPKTAASTVAFHFSGVGDTDGTWGHNISSNVTVDDNIRKVYNRIRVRFADSDTTSSYYIKKETWNWGDSSSSFMYGVRTYEIDNRFLDTTTAQTVATNIFNGFSLPKKEVKLRTKFIPHLSLNDHVTVTYKTVAYEGDYLWGYFDWGSAYWGARKGYNINLENADYQITEININLDNFSCDFTLREI